MNTNTPTPTNIDEYIATAPSEQQGRLNEMRAFVKKVLPEVTETIAYQMPTFDLAGKHLIYFAGYKNHLGFYPFPSGISEFQVEAEKLGYETSKGTIQFPNEKPIPWDLVEKIILFRAEENRAKVGEKGTY